MLGVLRSVAAVVIAAAATAAGAEADLKPWKGKATPPLARPGLDGKSVDLKALRGRVVLVNFWATWCDPCRREQPALVRTAEAYADRGVTFIGVNEKDNKPAARAWIRSFGVGYGSIFDPSGAFADDFGFQGLPDTLVVDRDGIVRYRIFGETTRAQLGHLVDRLLPQQ
jgi:cytochrome c biogenesis protein CcmG/thiol:disulfide interchange protein DsbE